MTDATPMNDKQRIQQEREARLAKNLRDNLRRRKAATRKKSAAPKSGDDKPADSP